VRYIDEEAADSLTLFEMGIEDALQLKRVHFFVGAGDLLEERPDLALLVRVVLSDDLLWTKVKPKVLGNHLEKMLTARRRRFSFSACLKI
jgi:hypothetical protein